MSAKKSIKTTKNIKAATKQTKNQTKQIGKTAKALVKAVKKIAKKSAPKKQPKKAITKKEITAKKSFRVEQIKQLKGKTWGEIMSYVGDNPSKLDLLKNPDEDFVARFYGEESGVTMAYPNARRLFEALNGDSGGMEETNPLEQRDIIRNLEILKIPSKNAKEHNLDLFDRKKERKMQSEELRKRAYQVFGGEKVNGRRKNFMDIVRDAMIEKQESDKRLSKLEKDNQKLMKMLKDLTKQSKKGSKNGTKGKAKRGGSSKSGSTKKVASTANNKKSSRNKDKKKANNGKRVSSVTKSKSKPTVKKGKSK